MRWADEEAHFIRPVRWIVALADDKVIPVEFRPCKERPREPWPSFPLQGNAGPLQTGRLQGNHEKAFVIVDQDERRDMIKKVFGKQRKRAAMYGTMRIFWKKSTTWWSIPLSYGRIDDEFLKLPVPAVVTPMRDHQRYYPVRNEDGSLMPYFLTVRNGGTKALKTYSTAMKRCFVPVWTMLNSSLKTTGRKHWKATGMTSPHQLSGRHGRHEG